MPSKKSTKSRKHRTRRHRGGYYGASGPIVEGSGGPAGMAWGTGVEVPRPAYAGGRRRRHKKGKKSTKRKTRGGSKFGATYGSFQGVGSRGLADMSQGTHKPGAPQEGRFNNFGADPKDFSSFQGLAPGSRS
jgi:hypothetical protein